jgi:SAM-dependent methyltransferase
MSKAKESVQSYWDARSDLFGNYYKQPSMFDRVFRKGVYERQAIAVEACRDVPNARVLDIGSGPGVNSVSLIKNGRAQSLLGIDFSEQMNTYARRTTADEGVADKCEFVLGDALDFDFGDRKFDYAYALGVFDYVQNAETLLRRMATLSGHSIMASWPADGVRMALRRYRYTCSLFHYSEADIRALHAAIGIPAADLRLINIGGGWASIAKTRAVKPAS